MKTCKSCQISMPLTEFYKHSEMADGFLSFCKECVKYRVRNHRKENESVREYDRKRYREDAIRRIHTIKNAKRWRERYPERYKAQTKLNNAVRDGKVRKEPCAVCGDENVHAHHHDYSMPLDVKWLCPKHHARLHAGGEA